jgi:hypothetical protein
MLFRKTPGSKYTSVFRTTAFSIFTLIFLSLSSSSLFAQEQAALPQLKNQQSILFVGNSFTFGFGSSLRFYHPETVADLNGTSIGGVPALFKRFTIEAGLDFTISLETSPGKNLDFHFQKKAALIAHP